MRRKNWSVDELLAGNVTVQEDLTVAGDILGDIIGDVNATVATTEAAAGSIGTGATSVLSRRSENGTIITDFKFDVTGLASVATANDVIGLAAGGVAYIGRNVVATNGIIYRAELICLETPVGGDDDINVVANASAALEYDGAGGVAYVVNGGVMTIGLSVENRTLGLTADHYFYLTAGAGDTAAAYTAGQYILRTYGHPALS